MLGLAALVLGLLFGLGVIGGFNGPDLDANLGGIDLNAGAGNINGGIGGGNVDLNGQGGNDFSIYNGGGVGSLKIRAIGTEGGQIASDGNFSVKTFANSAPIDSGNGLQNNLYIAYSLGTRGAIQNGNTSNIGFKIGSNFGFITLTVNHNGQNASVARYLLTIPQYGTSNVGAASANDCTSLPVELSAFKAHSVRKGVELLWQTTSEIDNAGFEVERSENAKDFKTLAFIEGNGSSLEKQDYTFYDENLVAGQLYYYRLKQIDFNGNFEYSEVITATVETSDKTAVKLTPNPIANGFTQLNYTTPNAGKLSLRVFDVAGKELLNRMSGVDAGTNNIDLDLSTFAKGIYFVKMEQNDSILYEQIVVE